MSDEAELRAAWTMAVGPTRRPRRARRRRRPPPRAAPPLPRRAPRHVGRAPRPRARRRRVPSATSAAVLAAAFFHDAVYDPRAADNEEQSARLAERVLGELGWSAARCDTVGPLVRATAAHDADGDADTRACCSTPTSPCSAPSRRPTRRTSPGVRAEYAHLDAAAWRAGRAAVLRDLLARRPLYATATGSGAVGGQGRRQHGRRAGHAHFVEPIAEPMGEATNRSTARLPSAAGVDGGFEVDGAGRCRQRRSTQTVTVGGHRHHLTAPTRRRRRPATTRSIDDMSCPPCSPSRALGTSHASAPTDAPHPHRDHAGAGARAAATAAAAVSAASTVTTSMGPVYGCSPSAAKVFRSRRRSWLTGRRAGARSRTTDDPSRRGPSRRRGGRRAGRAGAGPHRQGRAGRVGGGQGARGTDLRHAARGAVRPRVGAVARPQAAPAVRGVQVDLRDVPGRSTATCPTDRSSSRSVAWTVDGLRIRSRRPGRSCSIPPTASCSCASSSPRSRCGRRRAAARSPARTTRRRCAASSTRSSA